MRTCSRWRWPGLLLVRSGDVAGFLGSDNLADAGRGWQQREVDVEADL